MIKSKNKLTGGQAAVKSLKKEKVKHVFGLIGSATMEMFDALYHEKKIKFIGNKVLKDRKLKEIIVSEEARFWKIISKKKYLDIKRIELDKNLLKNYYKNNGY